MTRANSWFDKACEYEWRWFTMARMWGKDDEDKEFRIDLIYAPTNGFYIVQTQENFLNGFFPIGSDGVVEFLTDIIQSGDESPIGIIWDGIWRYTNKANYLIEAGFYGRD